jgi:PelA/Pel-15E family pectate lyase
MLRQPIDTVQAIARHRARRPVTAWFALAAMSSALAAAPQPRAVSWNQVLAQPAAWYGSADAMRIADNVRLYQRATGGWPKNIDMAAALSPEDAQAIARDRSKTDSTIDNNATTTQIQFLARVFVATREDRFRAAALSGVDYLLGAQYANGGWPQFFPLRNGYWSHITYNDNAMVNVMTLFGDIAAKQPALTFVPDATRERVEGALTRAIALTLSLQIRVNGELTGWCQQYDEITLKPAGARTYEHPSIVSQETVGIVRFLMTRPRDARDAAAVRGAIEAAVAWLTRSEIHGVRVERRPDPSGPQSVDVVAVPDASAPAVWARFYDIATNRPIYSGRDGVIKDRLADIEIERRAGYSWIGPYATALLGREYPAWARK